MVGIGNYTDIAEIAWNQGDTIYSMLDSRILRGLEYNIRYNLSALKTYPDQPEPWEPTGFSNIESECTYDNGIFYQAVSKSKRWEAVNITPDRRGAAVTTPGGWRTQALHHYKMRMGLPAEQTIWLQRAWDNMIDIYGLENWGSAPNWFYEWTGWGTLTKYRTSSWMAGDPGTWKDGKRISGIHQLPGTLKAADYDYFSAYAVWTGIGAIGTVLMGIFVFNEPANFWRVFFISTLINSIVGLKVVSH